MNGGAYYNENDLYAAEWLRNLIAGGHIAPGEVDTRSICDVAPADLRGFAQVHLFAGIGGWSYALRLAGVADSEPVWTGSCPCQPFSAAGKRKGAADERHLWPEMYRLIAACKPERVLGEQVEAAVRLGWIDGVFADLAREDYACGFAVLGAHSVGAPHIRQRIYWVANSRSERWHAGRDDHREHDGAISYPNGEPHRLADANGGIAGHRGLQPGGEHGQFAQDGCSGDRLADAMSARWAERGTSTGNRSSAGCGVIDRLAESESQQFDGRGATRNWWGESTIGCSDGRSRRVEPGIQPLAHGVSARVGKLRAAGNAIVPQVAAEFIAAALTRSV